MINLGDEAKDSVSGFSGVAVAKHLYLNGCTRISLQPKIDKDKKLPDAQTFDAPQLILVKAKKVDKGQRRTGGPEKNMPKKRPGE